MDSDVVKLVSCDASIMHISLNRPDRLNALSREVMLRLEALFLQAKNDPKIKVVLLTGEGKAFCAGADIKQLAALTAADGVAFAKFGQSVFRQLELLAKPSIAAIHGFAFGGGCELAMSATIRIAANNAVFGQPEIKLGVIPGFGGTQRLSRLAGKGRALSLCLTGRQFSAEEAFAWGVVTELTPPEQLLTQAKTLADTLVKMPPFAMQALMTTVHQGYDLPLDEAFALEAAQFGLCCATADKEEGVKAFLEKRAAVFSGE